MVYTTDYILYNSVTLHNYWTVYTVQCMFHRLKNLVAYIGNKNSTLMPLTSAAFKCVVNYSAYCFSFGGNARWNKLLKVTSVLFQYEANV